MEFPLFLDEVLRRDRHRVENLVVLARVGSTNSLARRMAGECLCESGRLVPSLVVAFEQTAGRCRHGRSWASPAGAGVYATYVLPVAGCEEVETLPFLAAVGLCHALNRHLQPPACRLRWPDELVVGDRMIGGLALEVLAADEEPAAALLSFVVKPSAASLAPLSRRPPELAAFLWDLVDGLTAELAHLGDGPYAVACYRRLSAHRAGDHLRCRLGEEELEGTFRGFDRRGCLRLACDGRERRLSAREALEA
jgi:BirA family biotin operon repressor/biotin-[acetyl-CoA-carboxylase] ligase